MEMRTAFEIRGYVVLRGLFTGDEVRRFRDCLSAARARDVNDGNVQPVPGYPHLTSILGDLLSKPELTPVNYMLFDDRVLAAIRGLIGEEIVYFGDSSVQTGEGLRGYHKDNVDRSGDPGAPDWTGRYPLVRVGVYCQDHKWYSGGLKLKPGSHRWPSKWRGFGANVNSEVGDVVIWNMRLTHSGNAVRLKVFPTLCLHPRVERVIPARWRRPEQSERYAVFGSFGAPGAMLDRYIEYVAGRKDYEPHFQRCASGGAVQAFLASKQLAFRPPTVSYGTLYASSARRQSRRP